MADLTELEAAQTVKIAGSSDGSETNYINSSDNNELYNADIFNNGGSFGAITVGTSATEVKVGASPLADRKIVVIYHNGSNQLYYGLSNSVTTSNGIRIFKNQIVMITAGENTSIWLISDQSGQDVRIMEMA